MQEQTTSPEAVTVQLRANERAATKDAKGDDLPRVAGHLNDQKQWASLQPDFLVVSQRTDGTLSASIVDPHGDYLADARAKLQALAAFAEGFGDRFVRIESVAKVEDGSLRVLDLGDPAVRADVLAFQGGKVTALYQSEHSRPYP